MPLYEYKCRGCGSDFEALVSSSETPSCPSCTSQELDKKFSVFAKPAASVGSFSPPVDVGGNCGSCCNSDGSGGCGLN